MRKEPNERMMNGDKGSRGGKKGKGGNDRDTRGYEGLGC